MTSEYHEEGKIMYKILTYETGGVFLINNAINMN